MQYDDLPSELIDELSAIEPEKPEPFVCAICEHSIDMKWPGSVNMWPEPPVCRYCASVYGLTNFGPLGSFRDRKITNNIKALAEALTGEAHSQHAKEFGYGSTRLLHFTRI